MNSYRWGTILPSEAAGGLTEKLRKNLLDRLAETDTEASLELLYRLREELARELAVGRDIPEQLTKLTDEISESLDVAGLQSIASRFAPLVTELFNVRSSVGIVCSLAGSFLDELLAAVCGHAVRLLKAEGKTVPDTPWALLVSGEMGREETVLGRRSSFFFIYAEGTESSECCKELALKFREVLTSCFPAVNAAPGNPLVFLWSGSVTEWLTLSSALLKGEHNDVTDEPQRGYAQIVETVADMRVVGGDSTFGRTVIDAGSKQLAESLQSELFWQYAKDTSQMSVAINMFGRFRVERNGPHRGTFDLKELVIDPMMAAARILSLNCRRRETSFTGRLRAILEAGTIGVALADRLVSIYQGFFREMLRFDLADLNAPKGFYFDPEQLDDAAKEHFRAGLEDITTLQRLVYQQLVGVDKA